MLKNIFSNWIGLLILGLISAILTPAMVHGLGNVYYGMWALVGSLIDYSGLLDMGMRATVFRYAAHFKGANERESLNQTFATGLVIAFAGLAVCALICVGLAFVLPAFFKFSGAEKNTFSWVVILMGLAVSLGLPGQFLSAYLRGLERFDLYNVGLISHGCLRGALLFILLKLGFGILPVVTGVLIMSIFFLVLHGLLVKWADPDLQVSLKHLNWKRTSELFNFGFYAFVTNSGQSLRYSTDSFVIGRVLSVSLVTPFSVATRLTEYFRSLMAGVSGPIMVRLSGLNGKQDEQELRKEFLRSTRFSMLLSIFIGGLLILNGKVLIALWVGSEYVETVYPILVTLTVGYVVMYGQTPAGLVIFARAQHHKAIGWLTLAEGVANLGLSILWARKYGLIGVALGTTVPLIVSQMIVQPWYALTDVNMGGAAYMYHGLARASAMGAVFFGCSWFLANNLFPSKTFIGLAFTCIWQTLFFGILILLFGLPAEDRSRVRAQGHRLVAALWFARSS